VNIAKDFRVAFFRAAIAALWLPATIFWRFAAWRSRLQTTLENENAGHERR
jgi:hypothetical protein